MIESESPSARPAASGSGGGGSRRWISERRTLVKVLVEPQGAIVAVTMTTYSYLFIVSHRFVGMKKIRTSDRVVARAGYSTPRVVSLISELYPNGP